MVCHDASVIRKVTRSGPSYTISLFAGYYDTSNGAYPFDNAGMVALNTVIGKPLGIVVFLSTYLSLCHSGEHSLWIYQ